MMQTNAVPSEKLRERLKLLILAQKRKFFFLFCANFHNFAHEIRKDEEESFDTI